MRFGILLASLIATPTAAVARPVVAIIDSGVAATPELSGSLIAEYDVGSSPARAAWHPRFDHGTMVATILVRNAGVPVDIISYRIDDPAGCRPGLTPPCQPSAAPIAAAIRHAAQIGVDFINLSLTLADDPAIVEAVREANARGVTMVMAAGNEGRDRPGNLAMARAGYPHAVLVGAIDARGRAWSGTNRPGTDKPEGFAYAWQFGVEVPTQLADGALAYATGTSFAAPRETARLVRQRLGAMSVMADAGAARSDSGNTGELEQP